MTQPIPLVGYHRPYIVAVRIVLELHLPVACLIPRDDDDGPKAQSCVSHASGSPAQRSPRLYLTANFPYSIRRPLLVLPEWIQQGKSRRQLATPESGFMRISGNAPKGFNAWGDAMSGRSAKSTDVEVETHRLNAEAGVVHIPGDSNFFFIIAF